MPFVSTKSAVIAAPHLREPDTDSVLSARQKELELQETELDRKESDLRLSSAALAPTVHDARWACLREVPYAPTLHSHHHLGGDAGHGCDSFGFDHILLLCTLMTHHAAGAAAVRPHVHFPGTLLHRSGMRWRRSGRAWLRISG